MIPPKEEQSSMFSNNASDSFYCGVIEGRTELGWLLWVV